MLPTSLEILNLAGGSPNFGGTPHKFTGGIPSEWGALTNLKELNMANCSLDGKSLRTQRKAGANAKKALNKWDALIQSRLNKWSALKAKLPNCHILI